MSDDPAEDLYVLSTPTRLGNHDRLMYLEEQISSLHQELAEMNLSLATHEVEIRSLRGQLKKLSSMVTSPPASSLAITPAPMKNLAAKPDPFNGKGYKDFLQTVQIYFAAYASGFALDEHHVLFVLSLMRGGLAGTWVQNYVDQNSTSGLLLIPDSWTEFVVQLDQTFSDLNEAMHAQTALLRLKQDGQKAEEFFARFDILR